MKAMLLKVPNAAAHTAIVPDICEIGREMKPLVHSFSLPIKQNFNVLSLKSMPVTLRHFPECQVLCRGGVNPESTLRRFIFRLSLIPCHPCSFLLPSSSATMSSVLMGSYHPSIYGGTFNAITNTYHATRPAITGKLISGTTSCH